MRNNREMPLFVFIPLLIVGAAIGLKFADLDQKIPFLVHRSLLTHGVLIPLLLLYLVRKQSDSMGLGWRFFTIGFSLANAVHLSFDLFPNGWYRHALIHIPFFGWMPALLSIAWIALSVLACLYIACLLIRETWEFLLSSAVLVTVFWLSASVETHRAFYAAIALIVALLIVLASSGRFATQKT